jgi:hypothetical protein
MVAFIRRKFFMILAILLICTLMFPLVFAYSLSLLIERVVGKRAAAAIEEFWNTVGKPYEYLLKLAA